MWANDFRHSDSAWPNSQVALTKQAAHLTEEERDLGSRLLARDQPVEHEPLLKRPAAGPEREPPSISQISEAVNSSSALSF